ncbi:MAG: hypothetical protein P1U34_04285 [Coxiellaceae bacterium]|nr:hypothetical protein [Coxiellaceae bacterium]
MVSIENLRSMKALQTKLTKLQQRFEVESKAAAAATVPDQAEAEERQAVVANCTELLALIGDWLNDESVKPLYTPAGLSMPYVRDAVPTEAALARKYLQERPKDAFVTFRQLMQSGHALLEQQGWISRSDSDVVSVVAKPVAAPAPLPKASAGKVLCNALRFLCCCGGGSKVRPTGEQNDVSGHSSPLLKSKK